MAIEKKSDYMAFNVDWDQVPNFNPITGKWEKRTEEWKKQMIGILGSEEAFNYQYGTQFSASDKCLVSRERLAKLNSKAELWENRIEDMQEAGIDVFLNYPETLYWAPDFDFSRLYDSYFLLCSDLSEGSGQDFIPFNIFIIPEKDKFIHIGRWYSNEIDLEKAALEFWLLVGQLFSNDRCIWSIEWNTYGALFYKMLVYLNENEFEKELSYRFNICPDGIEVSNFVWYKKTNTDEEIIGKIKHTSNYIPGIKFTSGNKSTACSLLKMLFEKEQVTTNDLITINELENFEDKNGNGSYKASYGQDDSIMTFVQIPMVQQTARYKELIDDLEGTTLMNNTNSIIRNFEESINPFDLPQIPISSGIYDIFANN